MGLFGPTRPLGRDELEWQLAGFRWLLEEFGGVEAHRETVLANPDGDYFADSALTGHARAEELFAEVKALAGLSEWPTRLVPFASPRGNAQVGPHTFLEPLAGAAAGTYQLQDDGAGGWVAEIRYDSGLLADQHALVATFGHELAHYLLSTARRTFPGGEELHELLTDLAAVFLGFGLFLANSARDYAAFQLEMGGHGWRTRRQGYLSERALVTALVISETLAGRDPVAARPFLKPYLRQDLDLAVKWFAKADVLGEVMAIDLADYGVEPLPPADDQKV